MAVARRNARNGVFFKAIEKTGLASMKMCRYVELRNSVEMYTRAQNRKGVVSADHF